MECLKGRGTLEECRIKTGAATRGLASAVERAKTVFGGMDDDSDDSSADEINAFRKHLRSRSGGGGRGRGLSGGRPPAAVPKGRSPARSHGS